MVSRFLLEGVFYINEGIAKVLSYYKNRLNLDESMIYEINEFSEEKKDLLVTITEMIRLNYIELLWQIPDKGIAKEVIENLANKKPDYDNKLDIEDSIVLIINLGNIINLTIISYLYGKRDLSEEIDIRKIPNEILEPAVLSYCGILNAFWGRILPYADEFDARKLKEKYGISIERKKEVRLSEETNNE